MKLTTNLEEMHPAISACLRCNCCTYGPWPENHTFCPLYAADQSFTHSAGGLLYLAKAILRGQMDYSQSLADLVFTCSACGACDMKCVIVRSINPEMALSDIIRLFRYELVQRGLIPEGPIEKMYKNFKEKGDLLGNGQVKDLEIPAGVQNDKADTLLITECMHMDTVVKSFQNAVGLLAKIGKQVAVSIDSGCCGSTLYDLGFWEQLPDLVQNKWKIIGDFGEKKLLFLDPHCQEFMTNKYPKVLDDFKGFSGQHISELLLDAFNEGKLKSKETKTVQISYHDPCFLGRGLGIYDAPRQVLQNLEGVELVEMKRNREQSFCCGARGLGGYFDDFANSTARERLNEFEETGAEILITACPYCKEIFGKVMGSDANRVKDLAEFVSERVE